MPYTPDNPLIVQSDRSLLLEVQHPRYAAARDALAPFAELLKSPEFIHTYQLTPLSLWNAAAAGLSAETVIATLQEYARFDLPSSIITDISDTMSRYGRLRLLHRNSDLVLESSDSALIAMVWQSTQCRPFLRAQLDAHTLLLEPAARGEIKQALLHLGFPAADLAGYVTGAALPLALRSTSRSRRTFALRDYQQQAVERFYANGSNHGGSGVVVLPCGAGKTMVGIGVMAAVAAQTLILCPNTVAAHQWISELLDKTDLTPDLIGEYSGERKQLRPVTVATYQILTYRPATVDTSTGEIIEFPHFNLFAANDWGLIIYDEVHLLPAPVFRMTATIQARRRLGLTATLVREDGRETDVFALIGPKKYAVPWRDLERQGWIATAHCTELRLDLPAALRMDYALADDSRAQYRIAAENPLKLTLLEELLRLHRNDSVLIIGQYLDQLQQIAKRIGAPLISGKMKTTEREQLYAAFKRGDLTVLVVSKVANFAIDLPDANVAIQVSGTYGSRQEEAQRLGRILRPKADGRPAHFYTLVTRDTRDQDFALNRQLFLTEQGYRYTIVDANVSRNESGYNTD